MHGRTSLSARTTSNELMTTAEIQVYDSLNQRVCCRTLLDTCSTANFITERLAAKLQLRRKKCSTSIGVLNQITTSSNHTITATLRSKSSGFEKTLEFLVIPHISEKEPQQHINRNSVQIPANIKLADPEFHKPAPVDMLLGTGPTLSLLSVGQINLSARDGPDLLLQKTLLGWVIGGSIQSPASRDEHQQPPSADPDAHSSMSQDRNAFSQTKDETQPPTNQDATDNSKGDSNQSPTSRDKASLEGYSHDTQIEFDMKKFWEIEEGPSTPHLSTEEKACEEHFQQHVQQDSTGRYIVALPFNQNKERLGNSRNAALKRFNALQRRFKTDPVFKEKYAAVMQEYIDLGHMTETRASSMDDGFFLPHHAVIKETSMTTKLRVVFDGSAKTNTGISLNDALMTGPTVQDDLVSHILRFRLHNYVLTGDIEKMYRQFLIRKEDRKFQRILWTNSNGELKTFELNTVTFGLSSAPFLATRCLQQIAEDHGHQYKYAGQVLRRDLYVDDLLTGAATLEDATTIRDEIIDLLHQAGMNIRQWASNTPTLLQGLPEGSVNLKLQSHEDKTLKTLGVAWNSHQDSIVYSVNPIALGTRITKRTILSDIAKIFDPLGLLGPVIITAKLIMQKLWQLKLDWDESVPLSIHSTWVNYATQLNLLNNLAFERRILLPDAVNIQLHGFCDASESGYGACIYLRSSNTSGQIQSRLLCAKSRVAPLKAVSLPRLELCGAQLLAKLYHSILRSIHVRIDQTVFWTDSTITLHWINSSSHLLKTFVANRVSDIQTKTSVNTWRHIPSEDNPADCLSRGQLPSEFIQNPLWQTGPTWLKQEEAHWPYLQLPALDLIPEAKRTTCLITSTIAPLEILQRYSSINKLRRIIAYCLRFKRDNRFKGLVSSDERNIANKTILRMVQLESFANEMQDLSQGRRVHRKSKLTTLDPFLDRDGIIRVGGRLKHANIPYSQQHPIVLPRSHHITTLIIRDDHIRNMHAGIQATLYSVRQRYWPIDGRNQARRVIRQCMKCFRANPPNTDYMMGNLPKARVNEDRPFSNVGIDYCGPFYIKEKKFRNRNRVKVYVAVFVCLAVKAVHMELVSDMTTEGFLAALRRFIARRGKCRAIHSDNGSNFVGACRELDDIHRLLNSQEHQRKVDAYLSNEGIKWHFIPPRSPHFGGLWEAAVKSFKHHVRRVIGNELLTFEQFNTFIIEVEAILNSRPLTPLSTDPNDLCALTPGHFLIGSALNTVPELDFSETPSNKLSTWQHLQKIKRDFWTRWHKEYLNELNIRHKWTSGNHGIEKGTLILIKEDNLPPLQWALGRVLEIHPGTDGIIRAVTIQTLQGTVKRNIRQLAPLPIKLSQDNCN
ncbi:uncharacterized protein LOC143357625 [Halictus rubicundus]|uniref:uncharacterized protein LOC143357625 n=1 Tax=Halictus rubicundus TaxID=77578 RepID=UPI004036328D